MSDLSLLSTPVPEPPATGECDACGLDEDDLEPDQKTSRCSGCKNRFFCSLRCQKTDWKKEHKFNCSPLNPAPVAVEYTSDQLKAEALRIIPNMKVLVESIVKSEKDLGAKKVMPPERSFVRDYVPPAELDYTWKPQDHDVYPYRHKLNIITRIILLNHISEMTPEQKIKLVNDFQDAQPYTPGFYCQLYGPKVLAYPGQLAPGEYAQLVGMMIPFMYSEGSTSDKFTRWTALKKAQEFLFNVRKAGSTAPPSTI